MKCKHCQAARDALFRGKILEASKHLVAKVVEQKSTTPKVSNSGANKSTKKISGAAGKQPKK